MQVDCERTECDRVECTLNLQIHSAICMNGKVKWRKKHRKKVCFLENCITFMNGTKETKIEIKNVNEKLSGKINVKMIHFFLSQKHKLGIY
jgi:hypothetical protein